MQGTVVYWMSRDQRTHDNWALLYAQGKTREGQEAPKDSLYGGALPHWLLELALAREMALAVVFCLAPSFLGASIRHYGFMLRGAVPY